MTLRSVASFAVCSTAVAFSCASSLVDIEPDVLRPDPGVFERAPSSHPVRLVVALKHNNVSELEHLFWAVSDPTNAQYGKYLNVKQLAALVSPEAAAQQSVRDWAIACAGEGDVAVRPLTPGGEFVEILATAESVERLLNCRMGWTGEAGEAATGRVACEQGQYALPAQLAAVVDFVAGAGLPRHSRSQLTEDGDGIVTPAIIRSIYTMGDALASNATTQATAQFYTCMRMRENNYSPADLDSGLLQPAVLPCQHRRRRARVRRRQRPCSPWQGGQS